MWLYNRYSIVKVANYEQSVNVNRIVIVIYCLIIWYDYSIIILVISIEYDII